MHPSNQRPYPGILASGGRGYETGKGALGLNSAHLVLVHARRAGLAHVRALPMQKMRSSLYGPVEVNKWRQGIEILTAG
jgi:hypothetical protein